MRRRNLCLSRGTGSAVQGYNFDMTDGGSSLVNKKAKTDPCPLCFTIQIDGKTEKNIEILKALLASKRQRNKDMIVFLCMENAW